MATLHLGAQGLERAELKLLDGAFGFTKLMRNFAGAALLDEALVNDVALGFRKLADELEEARAALDDFQVGAREIARCGARIVCGLERMIRSGSFSGGAFELIRDGVCGNAEEPGSEGKAAPFVGGKMGERFVEHVGGEIFGGGAVTDAVSNESIDALEMKLVERVELRRVVLSSLDKKALVSGRRRRHRCRSSGGHVL